MNEQLFEIQRLLRNLIRIGTVSAVNLDDGLCRVNTGKNTTNWLHWLNARAGITRSWNAPSVGEQVLVLCLGGELDTGFVLPGTFSDSQSGSVCLGRCATLVISRRRGDRVRA